MQPVIHQQMPLGRGRGREQGHRGGLCPTARITRDGSGGVWVCVLTPLAELAGCTRAETPRCQDPHPPPPGRPGGEGCDPKLKAAEVG